MITLTKVPARPEDWHKLQAVGGSWRGEAYSGLEEQPPQRPGAPRGQGLKERRPERAELRREGDAGHGEPARW